MNKYIKTFESFKSVDAEKTFTMYHGTTKEQAEYLITNGWAPRKSSRGESVIGPNGGRSTLLYVTTEVEDAQWFSNERGSDTVVKISNIPMSYLRPDPEDSAGYSMEELFSQVGMGMAAKFVIFKPIGPENFSLEYSNE